MRWEAGWKTLIGVELDTIYLMCCDKGANSLDAVMWGYSFGPCSVFPSFLWTFSQLSAENNADY